MSALPPRLRGAIAPVLTPFNADLSPVAPRFIRHCKSLLGQGAGLVVFDTTSEANSLTVNKKRALLDALLDAGLPRHADAQQGEPNRTRGVFQNLPMIAA